MAQNKRSDKTHAKASPIYIYNIAGRFCLALHFGGLESQTSIVHLKGKLKKR